MTEPTDASDATEQLPPTVEATAAAPASAAAAPPPASPFVPVYKEPWVNPAKRTNAIIGSLIAALVLLGAGFVVGVHVGRHHDRNDGFRVERGVQGYGWMPDSGPMMRRDGRIYYAPGGVGLMQPGGPGAPGAPTAPTPSPAKSTP